MIAAFCLAPLAVDAQSRRADAPVFGNGQTTCAQAMLPDQLTQSREWLFGYLTALGESFGPPSIWLGDAETIDELFAQTCASNPKFTLVEATRWVILALQDRYRDKRK